MNKKEKVKEKQRERLPWCLRRYESLFWNFTASRHAGCSRDVRLFTCKALHISSLGISKMTKECLFAYVLSGCVVMGRRKAVLRGATCCHLPLKWDAVCRL